MKIAIMGKGGSGKSTISWLLTKYISTKQKVIAIDADHNMDLTTNLGFEVDNQTPTIHRLDSLFRQVTGMPATGMWKPILENDKLPISVKDRDEWTKKVLIPVSDNIELMIGGLGCEDAIEYVKCSHGHLASLKYWLTYLQETQNTQIIIDSVAGTDMLNYGLYLPCDMVFIVIEDLPNSLKVAKQISLICQQIDLPFYFILNKAKSGTLESLKLKESEIQKKIKLAIESDISFIDLDYEEIVTKNNLGLQNLFDFITTHPKQKNTLDRQREFENKKK
jgi:CO dehydrogenase maturation factor